MLVAGSLVNSRVGCACYCLNKKMTLKNPSEISGHALYALKKTVHAGVCLTAGAAVLTVDL
jgi:hypothetical protein